MPQGAFGVPAAWCGVVASLIVALAAPPAGAQLERLLVGPKKIVDAAIEARSTEDIAKDNEIVAKFNAAMADLGSFDASSTICEQTLLITGVFDDKAAHDKLNSATGQISGIKTLYWKAVYLSAEDQKKNKDLMSWDDVLVMNKKAEGRLIGTEGVADVNFRATAEVFGTVYLIGRARSQGELDRANSTRRSHRHVTAKA